MYENSATLQGEAARLPTKANTVVSWWETESHGVLGMEKWKPLPKELQSGQKNITNTSIGELIIKILSQILLYSYS